MKEKICNDLNRLSLHDSNIEDISIAGSYLCLQFDWCKLDNYKEKNIDDGIIIGRSTLKISGYQTKEIKLDFSAIPEYNKPEPEYLSFEDFSPILFDPIGESIIYDTIKTAKITGFYTYQGKFCWLDWAFIFDSMILEWDSFITCKEWLNGKTPD